jgi:outer membrane protein assembly factor BamE (lipoprotein component of BamABCDE complex)
MKFAIVPFAAVTLLIACAPVISQRGYLPDTDIEAAIKPGTDTKTSVQGRLGYASTTATFGNDSWYYISATEKQVAFFTPTVLKRQILAVYFDKNNKVTDVRHYTLRDGHVITFEAARDSGARPRDYLPAGIAQGDAGQLRYQYPGNQSGQRRRADSVALIRQRWVLFVEPPSVAAQVCEVANTSLRHLPPSWRFAPKGEASFDAAGRRRLRCGSRFLELK